MGNTASCSSCAKTNLSQIFRAIIQWRSRPDLDHVNPKILWTESHLSTVLDYVLKLESMNCNFGAASGITRLCHDKVWQGRFEPYNYNEFAAKVVTFMQELHGLFKVPRVHQFKKNELVAAFVSFLLRLLDYETELIVSYEDQIVCLKAELRLLVTILGDAWLLAADQLEQVDNLLAEFEAVANEGGRLVCSFIFTTHRLFKSRRVDQGLGALLERIKLLKTNIIDFSKLLPNIIEDKIIPPTAAVESHFIVDTLLYDLEDLISREDDRIVDVKDQIKVLHQGLRNSRSLLKDLQRSEIQELKAIMMRIRNVVYEAKYLINSFLVGDNPLWYLTIRLPSVNHKIELIETGIQEIKENCKIGALNVDNDLDYQASLQAKGNFDVDDDFIVGFEEKETNILDQLVGGTQRRQIISIVGMPGLGKTTLAKKLYNHPTVNYYFDRRSWCVVSQTYQRKSLLIDILSSSAGELDKGRILNMEEERLAEHIYKSLKERRYLIVMDDIWDSNAWVDLQRYFPDDGNGSRIVFTTRNKDVAPSQQTIHTLPFLSNDQCWELLEKKVFHNKPCPPQLLQIGTKIAANCNGLPLAVVVVAGILSTLDREESTWKNVGGSLASYILSDQNNSMMQILKLSYKHLPNHLKPCFLYFGAFPEDTEIPVRKLKCLWIAEGFIPREENKRAENVAEEYLMQLVDKSLIIVAKRRSDGGAKTCVVHDLLRDLCLKTAEEENFPKWVDDDYSTYTKHQRLRVHMNPISKASHEFFPSFGLHLRSFFGSHLDPSLYIPNVKLPKVLDLPNKTLGQRHGTKHLVHLRYLCVNRLTAAIGNLVNLEFLVVLTSTVVGIPSVILKMRKLRYLHITLLATFDTYPTCPQTNNLEFLSTIDIKQLKDEDMLRFSPQLRKLKCNCVPFEDEKGTFRYPDFSFLTQLESLNMSTLRGRATAEINFPTNIRKLTLDGLCLPWEKMSIIGGLEKLQVLKLAFNAFMGEEWETREGEFQQLRLLKLNDIEIAQWNMASSDHFPKLQRLVLRKCDYLQEIPCEIGEIVTLQLIEVELCGKSTAESAMKIHQEQHETGNEELRLRLDGMLFSSI